VDQVILFISEVGFPIVVTLYLLYRIETKLNAVVTSIQTFPENGKNSRIKTD
jgi:hypothetical protein